jgi:purine-cytosine permease-like protein
MNGFQIVISVWGLVACINYHFYKEKLHEKIDPYKEMIFPQFTFNLAVIALSIVAPSVFIKFTLPEMFKRIKQKS